MFRLIVAFSDGSVNEFLCTTRDDAEGHLKKLKDVSEWEIKKC